MVNVNIDLLPKGHRNRPGYAMKPKGLLFHTTNNWADGAGDEAHAEYMEDTTRVVSWHETVDKNSCTQHIPHDENAWHAGDGGTGHYNRNWIGLETACEAVDRGERLDKATYDNAVERAAAICKEHGFGWEELQPHHIVYGKNCPHTSLFDRNQFKKDVFAKMKQEPKPKAPVGDGGTYKVQKGDTLSGIAAKYDTTVEKLVALNNISNPSLIHPGDTIALPSYLYVVESGDTLSGIAERFNTSVDFLVRLNGIEDPDHISVGQRIKLAGKAPAAKPKEPVKKATPKYNVPQPVLRRGDSGQAVIDLQEVLTKLNFIPGKIDGHYGPKTEQTVWNYQAMYAELENDGIYGPNTYAHIKKKI